MNSWYALELMNNDHINNIQNEREMDRLASAATGDANAAPGIEDLLSARALVARITVRAARPNLVASPRLTLHTAKR